MTSLYSIGVSSALGTLGLRKIAVDVRALLEESAPHLKDMALHTLGGTALGGLSGLAASDEDRIKGLRRGAIAGGLTGLGLSAGGKGLQYLTGRTPGQIAALETEGLAKLDAHANAQHEADLLFDSYLADAREHAGLQAADRTRALRRPELNRLQQLSESLNTQRPELENLAKDYDAAEREYAQFRNNLHRDIAARKMDASLIEPLTRGATAVLAPATGILSTGIGRDDGRLVVAALSTPAEEFAPGIPKERRVQPAFMEWHLDMGDVEKTAVVRPDLKRFRRALIALAEGDLIHATPSSSIRDILSEGMLRRATEDKRHSGVSFSKGMRIKGYGDTRISAPASNVRRQAVELGETFIEDHPYSTPASRTTGDYYLMPKDTLIADPKILAESKDDIRRLRLRSMPEAEHVFAQKVHVSRIPNKHINTRFHSKQAGINAALSRLGLI